MLKIVDDGRSREQQIAEDSISPALLNAATTFNYLGFFIRSDIPFDGLIQAFRDQSAKVSSGNLRDMEAILTSQVITLNAMFTDMATKAKSNLNSNVEVGEKLMRLAFKAQAQSRSSIEVLAEMKNPRPVFVQQANIQQANIAGGPQQVNNSRLPPSESARDANNTLSENNILEVPVGKRMER